MLGEIVLRRRPDTVDPRPELDDVKKQLESGSSVLDLQALDPTKQIKSAIQEGMAEGEKAMADAKSTFDNPLAEPESAPQIAAEPQPAIAEAAPIAGEPLPEPAPATVAESSPPAQEEKPAKAAAAG